MNTLRTRCRTKAFALLFLVAAPVLVTWNAAGQEEPMCVENSPERRGEIGCSIVETKPLPDGMKAPLFWHIDRFATADLAKAAITPASIAFEAHGRWWLMSIESQADDHHGGEHVASVKLPPLPEAAHYSFLVVSAYLPGGSTSRVHFHSGPEAFYSVDGEQCLETKEHAYPMHKGDTLAVPTGTLMRMVATGTTPRRAFGLIVHDASKPPTTRLPMEKASELVSCTK